MNKAYFYCRIPGFVVDDKQSPDQEIISRINQTGEAEVIIVGNGKAKLVLKKDKKEIDTFLSQGASESDIVVQCGAGVVSPIIPISDAGNLKKEYEFRYNSKLLQLNVPNSALVTPQHADIFMKLICATLLGHKFKISGHEKLFSYHVIDCHELDLEVLVPAFKKGVENVSDQADPNVDDSILTGKTFIHFDANSTVRVTFKGD